MFEFFLAVMLVSTLLILGITRLAEERIIKTHHGQKVSFFAHHPPQPADIVFLGDSLTEGARWDELFPGVSIRNRGIINDTSQGVLERLDSITCGQPVAIFILIGTNDLPFYAYRSDADILNNYTQIIQKIRTDSPRTRIFIQSLLPRGRRYARRIRKLNDELAALADKHDITFIPLFDHFATRTGALRPDLTNDSLHLLASGYGIWAEQLAPHIQILKTSQPPGSTG
ncbi:MAG TPA: GDSL-type esterase/lipase family protein [Anaerolineaceae bacterium]|jgi:lysophospholipase L1-like esterase|nr:GDSL-type esterase/lipase family protein [Anaerolineaceae bacterium]